MAKELRKAEGPFKLVWLIVHDCLSQAPCDTIHTQPGLTCVVRHAVNQKSTTGYAQMNAALGVIRSGWVWQCDDDNLPVEGFFPRLAAEIAANPQAQVILVAQQLPDRVVPPVPKPLEMDSAQFVYRREAVGSLRFTIWDYCADGVFIEALCGQVKPEEIVLIQEPLTNYNAFRPDYPVQQPAQRTWVICTTVPLDDVPEPARTRLTSYDYLESVHWRLTAAQQQTLERILTE
jgi:hypothetical protein